MQYYSKTLGGCEALRLGTGRKNADLKELDNDKVIADKNNAADETRLRRLILRWGGA